MPTLATIATAINGSVMDVPDSKFVAHQHIQIYPKNSPVTLNQKWTIVSDADGVPVPPRYPKCMLPRVALSFRESWEIRWEPGLWLDMALERTSLMCYSRRDQRVNTD